MSIQKLKTTILNLERLEERAQKKGYLGDATSYAFKRHNLELLEKLSMQNVERLQEQIDKLQRDLDFYIKEYPEQLAKLEAKR